MAIKTQKWDVTEHLGTEEKIALYLEAVFEDGDPATIAAAIGDVARARGMSQIAKDAGLSRESLYRSLSLDGNPEFATIIKVIKAIGFDITVTPHGEAMKPVPAS
jgi:probable addiction module antidote protein